MVRRVLVVVGLLLASASLVLADAPQTGVVTGTVLAPDGTPLPGATVQLQSARGSMSAVSDANGKFRFVFLPPGNYTARADLQGFQPAAGEIVVSAGGRADVELRLGEAMSEEILVTGEAPLVNKYDMTSGGTLDTKELEMITTAAQQYRSRLLFLPGVINEDDSDLYGGNRPTVSGLTGSRQLYFIDGVDVSFSRWGGSSQVNLPETAVGEMKLESTGADAQFSRSIGSYTTTQVRTGTNQFHGSGFYQMMNLKWNAPNKNIDTIREDAIKDGVDVSLGGPIVRDKLWFYVGYREIETPGYEIMADGVSVVPDAGTKGGSRLAKLDWRPSERHSLSAMYVLTPSDFPWWNRPTYGDLPTVTTFEYPGDITTVRWNFAISDSLLLTAHAARTTASQNRSLYAASPIDPSCDGVTPCGNNWLYRPFIGNARWPNQLYPNLFLNGVGLPLGLGTTDFPRDQFNSSLEWFSGPNDILFGVDYQKLEWNVEGVTVPLCRGRDFGYDVEGGFRSNADPTVTQRGWCEFFPTKETWQDGYGPISSGSNSLGVFIRDKIALKRWTFNLGLRMDRQHHENDVGETVLQATDIAPRLAASYDLLGDSTLLLHGSAGRYYAQVEMAWAASFNQLPQGRTQFEQYYWNPATSDYDIFYRSVTGATLAPTPIDPYYKDEVALGLEWQFHPDWAFKVNGTHWQSKDFPQIYDQIDATGTLYQAAENTPGAKSKRDAVDLVIQRRFKNNWMIAASYTYSRTKGNCQYLDNGQCIADYGELVALTNDEGVPWSHYNRYGSLPQDRPNVFKVRGAYNWKLGKGHSISIGGLAYYFDGPPWTVYSSLTDPVSGGTVLVFEEPMGSRRIGGREQLDLNLQWSFPIAGDFDGFLRAELINATDQQAQIGTAGMAESCAWGDGGCTGTPMPLLTSQNFQYPRTIRIQVGFNF